VHSGAVWSCLLILVAALVVSQPVLAETVNINKADAATLQHYLSGVGKVKAKAIVAYRKKHGKFKTVDDLVKVPGIGKATLKKNRKLISTTRGVTPNLASRECHDRAGVVVQLRNSDGVDSPSH